MIQSEIQRNKSVNPILNNESENETKRKISNIGFSQLLPFSSNMKDFGIEKNVILEIVYQDIAPLLKNSIILKLTTKQRKKL